MTFMEYDKNFIVKILESGRIDEYGDKWYSYKVVSKEPMQKVKEYCMKNLQKGYSKNKLPHPFAPILVEFRLIDTINEELGNIYIYKVKKQSTA